MAIACISSSQGFYKIHTIGKILGVLFRIKDIWIQVSTIEQCQLFTNYMDERLYHRYNHTLFYEFQDISQDTTRLFKLKSVNGNIQFSNVSFNYPSRPNARVLSGIDFKVTEGQKVALVGSSGCGKSTIVKLLLKLYECNYGQVSGGSYTECCILYRLVVDYN